MSKPSLASDPFKRYRTRYRGITYRVRSDGSRLYAVSWRGRYVATDADGKTPLASEKAALERQAELRGRGRGIPASDKTTFVQLAESWYETKAGRVRTRTASYYRMALDVVLLPRFGSHRLVAIDADAIADLVRDLERDGLHAIDPSRKRRPIGHSSIANYLKPLQGVLALAVRRRLIAVDPFSYLTADDRPHKPDREPMHEWTDAEIDALLAASAQLAAKPESRYDYTPLLRLTTTVGLRIGETLGLRWEDFDKTEGILHIRRQWTRAREYGPPKTRAGIRRIALPADLRDDLIALRLQSRNSHDSDPIFASRTGTPLAHRNVTARGFEPARNLAGLPHTLTFHDLRHACASRLIDAGLDPVSVAAVLGHEDPAITLRIYAARFNRQRKDDAIRHALAKPKAERRTERP